MIYENEDVERIFSSDPILASMIFVDPKVVEANVTSIELPAPVVHLIELYANRNRCSSREVIVRLLQMYSGMRGSSHLVEYLNEYKDAAMSDVIDLTGIPALDESMLRTLLTDARSNVGLRVTPEQLQLMQDFANIAETTDQTHVYISDFGRHLIAVQA